MIISAIDYINVYELFHRYETSGLNFISTQKEVRKGPNNITDVWTKFIEGMMFFYLLETRTK